MNSWKMVPGACGPLSWLCYGKYKKNDPRQKKLIKIDEKSLLVPPQK